MSFVRTEWRFCLEIKAKSRERRYLKYLQEKTVEPERTVRTQILQGYVEAARKIRKTLTCDLGTEIL